MKGRIGRAWRRTKSCYGFKSPCRSLWQSWCTTNCQHRKSLLKMAEAKKSRSPFDSQQSYTLHSHHGQKMTFVQSMGKSNISSQNVSNNGRKTENMYQKLLTNHLRLIFNIFSCLLGLTGEFFHLFLSSNFTLQKKCVILVWLMKISRLNRI